MNETIAWKALLATVLAAIANFTYQKIFFDIEFFAALALLVMIDTGLGILCGWQTKTISSKKFNKLIIKLTWYFSLLVATHLVATHAVQGHENTYLKWLDNFMYASIFLRELLSILEKSQKAGIYTPPQWLLSRLDIGNLEKIITPVAQPTNEKAETETEKA